MPKAASPKKATDKKKSADVELPKRLKPVLAKRQPKEVSRYTDATEDKKAKPIVIPKGKGKKLSDCPNVVAHVNKRKKSDDLLRTLHGLLLGRVNKKVNVKENLLAFNGVVYDDDKGRSKLEQKVARLNLRVLREALAFFGQDPEGERDELVPRLSDFLEKPKPSDDVFHVGAEKKRKRSRSRSRSKSPASSSRSRSSSKSPSKKKKRAKKDPNAPKRSLSAYMFFVKDIRPDLAKKYPTEKVSEIAKRMGVKWGKLTANDKKKYDAKAAKDKERYAKEKKKYESGSKK